MLVFLQDFTYTESDEYDFLFKKGLPIIELDAPNWNNIQSIDGITKSFCNGEWYINLNARNIPFHEVSDLLGHVEYIPKGELRIFRTDTEAKPVIEFEYIPYFDNLHLVQNNLFL